MPKTPRLAHLASTVVLIAGVGMFSGCAGEPEIKGASDEQSSASPSSASASASPSESTPTASESPSSVTSSSSAASPEPGCSKPQAKVVFTQGTATVSVPDGPNAGEYTLTINTADDANYFDPTGGSLYTFAGAWDTDDKNPGLDLSIDEPVCSENGFLGLTFEHGSVRYVDALHSACRNSLTSLNETGVAGTFTCTQMDLLQGEGRPTTIDASGTFTLTP